MKNKLTLEMQVSCDNCNLDDICIPRGLKEADIKKLNSLVQRKKIFTKGEFIYRQGDDFKGIFAVHSGNAKLVTYDLSGKEHILNVLLPGELFGFDGINNKHTCSAITLNTVSFCTLPKDQIQLVCQKIPSFFQEFFRHSGEKLNSSQERLILNKYSANIRLAAFLIDLSERLKSRGFSATDFSLPLSREEIGNYLGLTIETVSRIFKQLQINNLIKVHQKQVHIIDLEGLKNIVQTTK
jgi:CRP/FNR family transcriptional regulator, anaerobic regulatory protein